MARTNKGPWQRKGRTTWYATIAGKAVSLGTDDYEEAKTKWHLLTGKHRLGAGNEADARLDVLSEQRLGWVKANRKAKTYKVYTYFLSELCREYHAEQRADGDKVHHLPPLHFGRAMASKLRPHNLDTVVERHPKWGSQTVRGFKVCVLTMLKWAVLEGYVAVNPLAGRVKVPPVRSRAKEAVMCDEDFATITAHANEPLRDLLVACRHTGTRPDTLFKVSAESGAEVRFRPELRRIVAETHKTDGDGQSLVVDLDDTAFALCSRLAAVHPTGPLFLNNRGLVWTAEAAGKAMAGVRKKLKEKNIKLKGLGIMYGLRHNFATTLLLAGVPDAHVAALLGHKSTTMLHKHYSHLASHREALRKHLNHIPPVSPPPASDAGDGGE